MESDEGNSTSILDFKKIYQRRTVETGNNNREELSFLMNDNSCDDSVADADYEPSDENTYDIQRNTMAVDQFDEPSDNIHRASISSSVQKNMTAKTRKLKRNARKEYYTKPGKLVKERKLKELETCRKNCKAKLSYDDQKKTLNQYWNLGSYHARLTFLNGLIEIKPKQTERKNKNVSNPRIRNYSRRYYFELNGNRIEVCQKCFLFTLCETQQILKTVAMKKIESP